MSLDQLLAEAKRRGLRLWVEGERLRYEAPKGALTDDLLQQLRPYKSELMTRLRDRDAVSVHPVSFGQRALWFEYQLNPQSAAYNYAFSAWVRSKVHVDALRRAFQTIVDRHAILRTTYGLVNGEPVQNVHQYEPVAFTAIDASAWSETELRARIDASAHQPFDLQHGPVFRVECYTRCETEHLLLLNAHHIAMDFRSLGVVLEELSHLYAAECGAQLPALPVVRTQYADYAEWQLRMVESDRGQTHWAFWNERLSSEPPLLNLPTDRPRPAVRTYNGASLAFAVDAELSGKLKALARAERVTLYSLLVSAFNTLLHRYSHQEFFLVGSPMLGRTLPEFQRVLGYCISPVVLRADFAEDVAFRELLHNTHAEVLAALEHQDYPFASLVQRLQPARDSSRSPFFDVMFNLNVADLDGDAAALRPTAPASQTLALEARPQSQGEGQFDLILQVFDSGRALTGTLEYNTDLFDAATMQRMAGHFRQLLASVVADPDTHVSAQPMLTADERCELLPRVQEKLRAFPVDGTLHELLERQAARTPDRVAVKYEEQSLTYRELNERANRLARKLQQLGVGPEVLVGICVERSMEMVIGLLGILKAGGAYVPLDPAYPAERLAHMLADSRTPVLLTQASLLGHLPDTVAHVLCLDRDWPEIDHESAANLTGSSAPGNPAYVIYTSGSTGLPKGVVVCHEQVVRLFTATDEWFGFNERDVWTLFHSYAFDFSVWELWGALLYGGKLVVVPYLVSRSPESFCRLLAAEGVTVLNQTPSAFRQLLQAEATNPLPTLGTLRYIIFGGEALDLQSLRPWYERHGDTHPVLVNMYGITETTVHVTYRPLSWADVHAGKGSMIGRPIPDLQLHVLDSHGEPVPIGVPGELFVGGAGLARGYLNQPALTAQRFVAHPFAAEAGGRLYRTGDLARRRADGDVEYLGRVDQQVKIRGFRIEIGEIEATLKSCPGVADALVMAVGETVGEKRLVAYIQAVPGASPTVEDLRHHAKTRLPDYMVPASFVFLDAFPLTPSGKVDRRALPTAGASRPELDSSYVAPTSPREQILATIWADVLGIEQVGIDDNFFSLGGDSIRSIRVVAAAREQGIEIALADIFQFQTVRELATAAAGDANISEPSPHVPPFALVSPADRAKLPESIEDAYPLARLQAGMLFHAQLNPREAVYCNLSSLHLRLPFDAARLQAAIDAVVARHPALRTSFELDGFAEPLQFVHKQVSVPLSVDDIRYLDGNEQERHLREWIDAERVRVFDPSKPPLLRFHVHRRADDRIQLTWCEHHAILDGWSVATMLTEVIGRYLASLGQAGPVEEISPSLCFREFVAMERATVESPDASTFWQRRLEGVSATRLPRWQRNELVSPRDRFGQAGVTIPAELSEQLHVVARKLGVPVKSVLLAAHLKALSIWSGRREVLTGLISNGRPETADSEHVLGLFLNTVPLNVTLEPGSWADLVERVNGGEREVLPHRRYPLADIQRGLGTQDLIETSFNFIHFHVYQGLSGLGSLEVLDATAFERTNFTLMATFSLNPIASQPEVGLTLHYDARELCDEQIRAISDTYVRTLESLVRNPAARHETADLLTAAQRHEVLETFNATVVDRPPVVCLHEMFRSQAARTPDAVALVSGDDSLTYRELDERSNRLARYLQTLGVGPETMVGVCMERTADLVLALMSVLKAGGAYVPLDIAYPAERLAFILADAQAPVVLTTRTLADRLAGVSGRLVCVDALRAELADLSCDALANTTCPSNLAYIIYTSGSTGRPKGVAIEHRSGCELIRWARDLYSDADLAGVLASTSICFDLSIFEIFVPLSCGGRVVLVANALALPELDASAGITLVNTVPSAMTELVRLGGLPASVRTVNLAGEPLLPQLVDQIYATGHVQRVYDLYGPSEDTTYSTGALRTSGGRATIGGPISNTRVYILDENLQPVPRGATGELYIAGAGLARGYLRRAELTAERFLPDPFSGELGCRMYRTGDLARYMPDGNIEFLGRADYQVKIRGFRIELGEIESAINACPGVRAAVVAVIGDGGDKRLVGYYVLQQPDALTESDLRGYLTKRLPSYMVPTGLVELTAMPMTPNGKIDRKALPEYKAASDHGSAKVTAPRDEIERHVADCWQDLLGIECIGIDENFFELGGHSLLATQVVSRLRERFGVQLSLRSLFDAPTIAGVAAVVRQTLGHAGSSREGGDEEREEIEL